MYNLKSLAFRSLGSFLTSSLNLLLVSLVLAALPSTLSAAAIVVYAGGTISATSVTGGVTASDFGVGSSSDLTGFTATSPGGTPGDAFEAINWTTANIPDPLSAFVFSLQSSSYVLTLTDFNLNVRPQGAGPEKISILYQIDSDLPQAFSPELTISTFDTWEPLAFEGNITVPAGSTVKFFISGYDAQNTNKSMQADSIVVSGTVVVPEPQTLALVGLGLSVMFFLRRSRKLAGTRHALG